MDYKRANRAFLYMILATLAFVLMYSLYVLRTGSQLPIILNNVFSELMGLIPAVTVVLFAGDSLRVLVLFKRIKIPSALLTLVYVFLLFPLVAFANAISMLFVDNTVLGIADQIYDFPFWQMFLSIGIFAPFVEEFIFRGIILQSYQRTGRIVGSIILSSLLFGMLHMNVNQFVYATVMGIMLALLVEATGSVLTSFMAHAFFNSIELVVMYLGKDLMDQTEDALNSFDLKEGILLGLGVYFVLAVICTAIAVCVLVKISDMEGRLSFLRGIPSSKKQGYKLITVPLVVAAVLSVGYMLATELLLSKFM